MRVGQTLAAIVGSASESSRSLCAPWDGRCVLECTHADLDLVLEELGYKRYKSKLKHEKITMLMKAPIY
jgi:hypothetical protein